MDTVKRNNDRIASGALEPGDAADQGFVRPTALLLAPTRGAACGAVLRLLQLARRGESRCAAAVAAFLAAASRLEITGSNVCACTGKVLLRLCIRSAQH
jgi:hypothetical protein